MRHLLTFFLILIITNTSSGQDKFNASLGVSVNKNVLPRLSLSYGKSIQLTTMATFDKQAYFGAISIQKTLPSTNDLVKIGGGWFLSDDYFNEVDLEAILEPYIFFGTDFLGFDIMINWKQDVYWRVHFSYPLSLDKNK